MSEMRMTKDNIIKLLRDSEILMIDRPDLGYGYEGQSAIELRFKFGKLPVLKFDNATRNLNIVNANATILRFIAGALEMDNP